MKRNLWPDLPFCRLLCGAPPDTEGERVLADIDKYGAVHEADIAIARRLLDEERITCVTENGLLRLQRTPTVKPCRDSLPASSESVVGELDKGTR